MLTTIHPPIREEDMHWMMNHNWTFQETINPYEPIHIMLGHFAWHCFAVQNNRKIGSCNSFRIDSLPNQFRTKDAIRLHSLAIRWFSVPLESGNTIDPTMMAVASKEDLDLRAFIIDDMDCGLELRMMPPESGELRVSMYYPDRIPWQDKPEMYYTLEQHIDTIHLLITDKKNRIRAHCRLNISKPKDEEITVLPLGVLNSLSAVANIGPILAYVASLQMSAM